MNFQLQITYQRHIDQNECQIRDQHNRIIHIKKNFENFFGIPPKLHKCRFSPHLESFGICEPENRNVGNFCALGSHLVPVV